MNHSITLTKGGDRFGVLCRSWREVRHVLRQWRPTGYKLARAEKVKRRRNWLGDRTFARHALRALEDTK